MEVCRVDTERIEVAVQRTAVAFDCCGSGRGRAEDGDGITEKASGRFTGTHLFAHFPKLLCLADEMNMRFATPVYNAQEFIPAMQIARARLTRELISDRWRPTFGGQFTESTGPLL